MTEQSFSVEGVEEVKKAFRDAAKGIEYGPAAIEAGEALIPHVASLTRRSSGALAAGWGVQQADDRAAMFINQMDYWTFQEFGTAYVEPTHAIWGAWEQSGDVAIEAYDKAVSKAAEEAGFGQ